MEIQRVPPHRQSAATSTPEYMMFYSDDTLLYPGMAVEVYKEKRETKREEGK